LLHAASIRIIAAPALLKRAAAEVSTALRIVLQLEGIRCQ
jgi:hypothetical protein